MVSNKTGQVVSTFNCLGQTGVLEKIVIETMFMESTKKLGEMVGIILIMVRIAFILPYYLRIWFSLPVGWRQVIVLTTSSGVAI